MTRSAYARPGAAQPAGSGKPVLWEDPWEADIPGPNIPGYARGMMLPSRERERVQRAQQVGHTFGERRVAELREELYAWGWVGAAEDGQAHASAQGAHGAVLIGSDGFTVDTDLRKRRWYRAVRHWADSKIHEDPMLALKHTWHSGL